MLATGAMEEQAGLGQRTADSACGLAIDVLINPA